MLASDSLVMRDDIVRLLIEIEQSIAGRVDTTLSYEDTKKLSVEKIAEMNTTRLAKESVTLQTSI